MVAARSSLFTAALAVALAQLCPSGADAQCPEFLPPQEVGTVQRGTINEASGLAA
ncbi:hypothetical protein LCGC14_2737280, partial [marine sediment metagenome]